MKTLPVDHDVRMQRALCSLEGLAIADAVGEMLAYRHYHAPEIINQGLPAGPWFRTDDSEMAISIVEVLRLRGCMNQDELAQRFAWRYEREPDRGYGKMTRIQMRQINEGGNWREGAANAFGGQGSMGNGGAMRVAPIGGYFADNFKRVAEEAALSAAVTHTHNEGISGAIAVAIAAASVWQSRSEPKAGRIKQMFDAVLEFTPESKVRRGVLIASQTAPEIEVEAVAKALGCGFLVTAPDTVPFALWSAAHNLDNYVEALKRTIVVGGDCDTNAAIVGGIISLSVGREGIPSEWRQQKEPLPFKEVQ